MNNAIGNYVTTTKSLLYKMIIIGRANQAPHLMSTLEIKIPCMCGYIHIYIAIQAHTQTFKKGGDNS